MGMVIPAKQHDDWGGDLLQFAQSLAGKKLEEKKIGLQERSLGIEEQKLDLEKAKNLDETAYREQTTKYLQEQILTMAARRKLDESQADIERQIKVQQAAGLTEEARKLKGQNDFLESIKSDPEALRNYYMQGALTQENNMLRINLQAQAQQVDNIKTQFALQQQAEEQQRRTYEGLFGGLLKDQVGKPLFGTIQAATMQYMNAESPEAKTKIFDSITKMTSESNKLDMQSKLATQQAETQQTKSIETGSSSALNLMKNPTAFASSQDHLNYVNALLSGQQIGKDFALRSKDTNYLTIPLLNPSSNKFTFVPLSSDSSTNNQNLEQVLKALKESK
jgi:hypothetical protein